MVVVKDLKKLKEYGFVSLGDIHELDITKPGSDASMYLYLKRTNKPNHYEVEVECNFNDEYAQSECIAYGGLDKFIRLLQDGVIELTERK